MTDYIKTLEDVEDEEEQDTEEDEEEEKIEGEFKFDYTEVLVKPWNFEETKKKLAPQTNSKRSSVDQKIQEVLKYNSESKKDESDENSINEDEEAEDESDGEYMESESHDHTRSMREFKPKRQKKDKFFSEPPPLPPTNSFDDLHLSRPLIKAISDMGWQIPTPVQQQVIPIALSGRDLAASAVTGSGKTAAFVLPILERLLYRDMRFLTVRVLILTPTRELAAQCQSVIVNLSKYTNEIRCSLVLGGMPLSQQSVELRQRPDIIVATPGRLIDHLLNTPAFGLEHLEILVLDEADRLLELGFKEEIEQIVKLCPKDRQSMLFSATMTEKVSELMTLSLHRPVRVTTDPLLHTSKKLTQEFVRIRKNREEDREAILLALCTRTFKSAVLIFFREKRIAHRMKIIFGLVGLSASELHGNLTQLQRLEALEQFRDGKVNFLLATDLASRGLDIVGMQTVINYSMPMNEAIYVHRVGRTARAGKKGRAVSLVGDTGHERQLLKDIVRRSPKNSCKHRLVPQETISMFISKIELLQTQIDEVIRMEIEEKAIRKAEMEAEKMSNIIKYQDDITSRPPRTWFISENEKMKIKEETKKKLVPEEWNEEEKKPEEPKPEIPKDEYGKPKYIRPKLPSLDLPLTKRQKQKKAEAGNMLSPSQYKLAKKKNKIKTQLKRQRPRNGSNSKTTP